MATAAQKRHWSKIVELGCLAFIDTRRCGRPAEIAHCHGGSIVLRMQEPKAKGKKLSRYDWLVIPLCPEHHRGQEGLDLGVREWEKKHGLQATMIDHLCAYTDKDLWSLAAR